LFGERRQFFFDPRDVRLAVGIVVLTEPVERFFMIFVVGVAERFKHFGIAPWSSGVLWGTLAGGVDDPGICELWISWLDPLDFDAVVPAVAKVVEIPERLAPRAREGLSQGGLARIGRPVKAVVGIGYAIAGPPKAHFPKMRVGPCQRCLEDSVQAVEPDIERNLKRSADDRRDPIQRDRHPHHEAVAHAAFSSVCCSLDACQRQGKSSSIRLMG